MLGPLSPLNSDLRSCLPAAAGSCLTLPAAACLPLPYPHSPAAMLHWLYEP